MTAKLKLAQASEPAPTEGLAFAFPDINPGIIPFGSRVLVQIRRTQKYKTLATGQRVHFTDETLETDKWNTQIAKVIAMGPVAFKSRKDLTPWPEAAWCAVGDYVRCAKYGGDRWEVPIVGQPEHPALFVIFNDLDLIGKVTGDPLSIKAFV